MKNMISRRGRRFYSEERSGRMDGSQHGWTRGGFGRNRTDKCRHPEDKEWEIK